MCLYKSNKNTVTQWSEGEEIPDNIIEQNENRVMKTQNTEKSMEH